MEVSDTSCTGCFTRRENAPSTHSSDRLFILRIFSWVQVLFVKKNSDKYATLLKLFDICPKIC